MGSVMLKIKFYAICFLVFSSFPTAVSLKVSAKELPRFDLNSYLMLLDLAVPVSVKVRGSIPALSFRKYRSELTSNVNDLEYSCVIYWVPDSNPRQFNAVGEIYLAKGIPISAQFMEIVSASSSELKPAELVEKIHVDRVRINESECPELQEILLEFESLKYPLRFDYVRESGKLRQPRLIVHATTFEAFAEESGSKLKIQVNGKSDLSKWMDRSRSKMDRCIERSKKNAISD